MSTANDDIHEGVSTAHLTTTTTATHLVSLHVAPEYGALVGVQTRRVVQEVWQEEQVECLKVHGRHVVDGSGYLVRSQRMRLQDQSVEQQSQVLGQELRPEQLLL